MVEINKKNLGGGWAVGPQLYEYIKENLPSNKSILEFGSGVGSNELGKVWNIQCVEHDSRWIGVYPHISYVFAPITNKWYDHSYLRDLRKFDLILIDGPPANIGRKGILKFISTIKNDCLIIVDDVNRPDDHKLLEDLSRLLDRNILVVQDENKQFGVILQKAKINGEKDETRNGEV
jgi:hypothetical protein